MTRSIHCAWIESLKNCSKVFEPLPPSKGAVVQVHVPSLPSLFTSLGCVRPPSGTFRAFQIGRRALIQSIQTLPILLSTDWVFAPLRTKLQLRFGCQLMSISY